MSNVLVKNPMIISGSGGGSLGVKDISYNGTYNASDDGYTGYSRVRVDVAGDGGTVMYRSTYNGITYCGSQSNYYAVLADIEQDIMELKINDQCISISADFSKCPSLKTLYIPAGVKKIVSINSYTLYNLTKIYYKGTIEDWCKIQFIDSNVGWRFPPYAEFYAWDSQNNDYKKVTTILDTEFSENTINIPSYSFQGYKFLEELHLNTDSKEEIIIEDNAFQMSGVEVVEIQADSVKLGNQSFDQCQRLHTLSLDNFTPLDQNTYETFNNCRTLRNVTLESTNNVSVLIPNMFEYCKLLTHIDLSLLNITSIPNNTFRATGLVEVTLPETLVSIGYYAFAETMLSTITIPSLVEQIDDYAFTNSFIYEIINLSSLSINPGDSGIASYASYVYTDVADKKVVNSYGLSIYDNSILLGIYPYYINNLWRYTYSYTLPQTVTNIGPNFNTFMNQARDWPNYLYQLVLSSNFVDNLSLGGWSSIAEVIKNGASGTISVSGTTALLDDDSGSTLDIINNFIYSHGYIFGALPNYLPDRIILNNSNITRIVGLRVVESEAPLVEIDLSQTNITRIDSSLQRSRVIRLPSTLTIVGDYTFRWSHYYDDGYDIIDFKGNVSQWLSLNDRPRLAKNQQPVNGSMPGLYINNALVDNVTIPNTIQGIGGHSFDNAHSLNSVEFESNSTCTAISGGFVNTNITEITIPASVNDISAYAFKGTNLNSISVENGSVYSVIDGMLMNDSGKSVCVGTNTSNYAAEVNIGYYAFAGRDIITLVPVFSANPNGPVSSIGGSAFENCQKLFMVDLRNTEISSIQNNTFENCQNLRKIYLSDNTGRIERSAFKNCDLLEEITILYPSNNIDLNTTDFPAKPECHKITVYVPEDRVDSYKIIGTWGNLYQQGYIDVQPAIFESPVELVNLTIDPSTLYFDQRPKIYGVDSNNNQIYIPNGYFTFSPALSSDGRFEQGGDYHITLNGTELYIDTYVSDEKN